MEKLATEFVISVFGLNNITEKEYSPCQSLHSRDAYIFHSDVEYYNYFMENGLAIVSKELLDLAIFSKLRNGDIIALKGLCDYIIDNKTRIEQFDLIPLYNDNTKQKNNEKINNKKFFQKTKIN